MYVAKLLKISRQLSYTDNFTNFGIRSVEFSRNTHLILRTSEHQQSALKIERMNKFYDLFPRKMPL